VGAAASLRGPLEAIAALFDAERDDARTRLAFGASSALAAQIRAGAPLDVFVSADDAIAERLIDAGLARPGLVVAGNRLVVVAREGAPALASASDLVGPGVRRIAIPQHVVPVGRYAREWLAGHGLAERVAERAVHTEHARATLLAVDQGHADAAIVYVTDARIARSARVAFEIPAAEQPDIAYVAVALVDARAPELARAFLAFLGGARAGSILRDAGFEPGEAATERTP
jgi:molybdate transport system substrate-binding protein